ncbi:hypothetical protein LMJ53_14230 [Rheinheimera sp. UJ51]|uniref:hypothetical protein n=1 Tax=Rheinheimera sp. UJ51 TaxID=2892446 RepID=UPI001E2831E8|nr:hypothetical protein [Rheinheimera sp. UJ51]MCC5452882.1 hypothetical protein [Rheinheimera sp. UJ51]
MNCNDEDLYRDAQKVLDFFKNQLTYKLFNKLENDSKFDVLRSFEKNFFDKNGVPFFRSNGINLTIVTEDKSKALDLIKTGIEQVKNDFEFPDELGKDELGIRLVELDLKGLITYGSPKLVIEDNELVRAFKQFYPDNFPKEFNLLEDLNKEEVSVLLLQNLSIAEPHVKLYFQQELKRQYHNGGYHNVLIVFCDDADKYEFNHKLNFGLTMRMKH